MNASQILRFARKHLCRAVVIEWVNPEYEWHWFRIERVSGKLIYLTGMAVGGRNPHVGDFFDVNAEEIRSIKLR